MWSGSVELPSGYSAIEVVERACPRPQYVTYEIDGPRASGSITLNLKPWSEANDEMWITAGRISQWTFNGPRFHNDLTVDGLLVDFSGTLPREDPFPLKDKILGQGLEFEWSGAMPQASCDYASTVIDAVVGIWHESLTAA